MTWWDDDGEVPPPPPPRRVPTGPDPTVPPHHEPTAVWVPPEHPEGWGGVGGPPTAPGGGGYGAWPPQPPGIPPGGGRRRPRRRHGAFGAVLAATVLALAAGGILAYASTGNSNPFSSAATPSTAARSVSQARVDPSAIANNEDPAIVDVTSTLAGQEGEAAGTGMILTSTGEILTNNHVIEGSASITVKISNSDRTYPARVLGTDVIDDVAVIQAEGASGLPTITLGSSSQASVGDAVVAIGNAYNKPGPPTVTQGTITGLNRAISVRSDLGQNEQLSDLVETNAQLEPGNSGGPLFDATGHVIGMNTAAAQGNIPEGGTNDGYAIPVNDALTIVHQIETGKSNGNVSAGDEGFLGVNVSDSGSGGGLGGGFGGGGGRFGNAGNGGGGSSSGVVITGVQSGSPADNAGLTQGDEITSVDGQTVTSANQLTQIISTKHPGDAVKLVWTDGSGNQQSATVRLGARPSAA
jgi:S1-C subfamily serine protease